MTHRYRIESPVGLIIDKFQGRMAWQDVLEGILRSSKDPEFQPGMNVLADLTAVDLDFGYEGVRALTFEISRSPKLRFGKIAVVAPASLQFGLARMFGMLADDYDIIADYKVFSNFSKARAWLGLPSDIELRL